MNDLEKKVKKAEQVLQVWANTQGHDKCHHNPEVIDQLAEIFDIKPIVPLCLPPEQEFGEFCIIYRCGLYGSLRPFEYD